MIGRGRLQAPQRVPQGAFGGWPTSQQWSPTGLGADAPAYFVRKGGAKERLTLDEWQTGLQSGKIKPDGTTNGVRWVRVLAYGTNEIGREILLTEQVPWPSLAHDIFRYGDVIPHPTMGVLYVQPFIYDTAKSYNQLIEESNASKTLRCTVQCGTNGVTWCRSADYTDQQAQGWVSENKKKLDCTGIGQKPAGKYVVEKDGSIVWQGGVVAKAGDRVYCPSSLLQEAPLPATPGTIYAISPEDNETLTTVKVGKDWAKKHPCQTMACRDVDTGKPVNFYDCPVRPPLPGQLPPGGGGPEVTTAGIGTLGKFGIAAAVIAVIAAVAMKSRETAPTVAPAAAEGRR